MHLIVGLGNPGSQYSGTRHNAGFMAVNRLAEHFAAGPAKAQFHASVIQTQIDGQKVLLMQPLTYMNASGQAVAEAARFFRIEPANILVIVDDTALPVGVIRLKHRGGDGGHNGLADIQRALGTDAYPRLRIGVGEPRVGEQRIAMRDYVLGRFTEEERSLLPAVLERCTQATRCWLTQGIDAAMNKFNEITPNTDNH